MPTFAVMALLTGLLDRGPMDVLCSAGHGSPLSGMALMYLLMSAFHSPPWLKLISGQRRAFRACWALARLTRWFKDPANQSELGSIDADAEPRHAPLPTAT
jgi:hypothetical protein